MPEMEVMEHQNHPKMRPEAGRQGIVLDGECCRDGGSIVLMPEVELMEHQHHPKTRPMENAAGTVAA